MQLDYKSRHYSNNLQALTSHNVHKHIIKRHENKQQTDNKAVMTWTMKADKFIDW